MFLESMSSADAGSERTGAQRSDQALYGAARVAMVLAVVLSTTALAADDRDASLLLPLVTESTYRAASAAIGFCEVQSGLLAEIQRVHPQLAPRAQLSEIRFTETSGGACRDISAQLDEFIKHKFPSLSDRSSLKESLASAITTQVNASKKALLNEASSLRFIDEVAARAEGAIDALVARPLVAASVEFRRRPHMQWPRWTSVWTSRGHPKSNGVSVRLRAPVSFQQGDPTARHMLTKWTQYGGPYGGIMMLQVAVFPYEGGASAQSFERELSAANLNDFAQDIVSDTGGSVDDVRRASSLGRPAVLIKFRQRGDTLDTSLIQIASMLHVVTENGILVLGCSVSLPEAQSTKIDDLHSRYTLFCKQFMNSVQPDLG